MVNVFKSKNITHKIDTIKPHLNKSAVVNDLLVYAIRLGAEPEHAAPEDPLAVERARALAELRRLDENIEDAKLSAQIVHMEEVTGKIFDIVAGQPAKLPQLRRFLNYYLPTTLKLLNAYDRMGAAGVEGANIDGTMGRIDAMMDKVVEAFDKQLDALFADEALDISTDITVLEQMLAQEGLGGMQMGQS